MDHARTWFVAAASFVAGVSLQAADFYIAPNGSASGQGTQKVPYDLATALSGTVGQPGDTFWLRGGVYHLGHLVTQIHGTPGRPITFRQAPGERAQVAGSLVLWGAGAVTFQDFEIYGADTNRLSRQIGIGFHPTDITNYCGIETYAPNCSFINLLVHDAGGSGFYTSTDATNILIYGCVVYNCGWASPDNAEGHSFYLQGPGEMADNLGFNSTGAGFHIYTSGTDGYLRNMTFDGNVAFGAGALQNIRPYRDWIVGVDPPSDPQTNSASQPAQAASMPLMADNITLKNNMGYLAPNSMTLMQVQIGREQVNGAINLSSNYWPLGVVMNNWRAATVTGNVFAAQNSDYAVDLQQTLTTLSATWDNNVYAATAGAGNSFRMNSKRFDLAAWKAATGWDSHSSFVGRRLTGTKVFVRPNRYEKGRAHIIVYNWDNLDHVPVDLSSAVALGTRFEVRNAQDFNATPVLAAVYDGKLLSLPMTGLTVAPPLGPFRTPSSTGPTFGVFVLLPVSAAP